MIEIWKPIRGYDPRYTISNNGHIKSNDVLLTNQMPSNGRVSMRLLEAHYRHYKTVYIHRLVAEAFVPNPLFKKWVTHIDYNRENNRADNLEWCTRNEVMNRARLAGRLNLNGNNKTTDRKIKRIIALHKKGLTYRAICKKLNLFVNTVAKYIKQSKSEANGYI